MPSSSNNIPQLYLKAMSLMQQGSNQQAVNLLNRILQLEPGNLAAAHQLARLLVRHQQMATARAVLEKVEAGARAHFEILHMLGALRLQGGDAYAAIDCINRALALKSDAMPTWNIKGNALLETGQFDDAVEAFKKAISLNPKHVDPHNNIAWAYRALGEKSLAIEHFAQAYSLDKNVTEALSGILLLQKNTRESFEVAEAIQRLNDASLKLEQRVDLLFALGKAYEDIQDYPKAFQCFEQGNSLWRNTLSYNTSEDTVLFETIKSAYQPSMTAKVGKATPVTPIFVLGMPRSATSLVEQILASHSQVTGAGELRLLADQLLHNGHFGWQTDQIVETRASYLDALQALSDGSPYVVDKMPQNFRFIGVILQCFPEAKIIHCQRDAKDNCLSLYKHHFPMNSHPYAYQPEELAAYHRLYQELMAFWNQSAPEKILNVRYETLVDNFDRELNRILDFTGLPFEPGCKQFQNTRRAIRTASSDQVRRGLYKSGVGQWKHYEHELSDLFNSLDLN